MVEIQEFFVLLEKFFLFDSVSADRLGYILLGIWALSILTIALYLNIFRPEELKSLSFSSLGFLLISFWVGLFISIQVFLLTTSWFSVNYTRESISQRMNPFVFSFFFVLYLSLGLLIAKKNNKHPDKGTVYTDIGELNKFLIKTMMPLVLVCLGIGVIALPFTGVQTTAELETNSPVLLVLSGISSIIGGIFMGIALVNKDLAEKLLGENQRKNKKMTRKSNKNKSQSKSSN